MKAYLNHRHEKQRPMDMEVICCKFMHFVIDLFKESSIEYTNKE